MTRPPPPKLAPMPPAPERGFWRATPPAIFPPVLGLLALALAWRRALAAAGLPPGAGEMLAGAVSLLALFALAAYAVKLARRPAVAGEDLAVLPGRAGLTAAAMTVMALGAVALPYAPGAALALALAGLALHAALLVHFLTGLRRGPAAARRVSPVWHLALVGGIVADLVLAPAGPPAAAQALFWASMAAAAAVWALSLAQLAAEPLPAALRPLIAIHLAPAALGATVAADLGLGAAATALAGLTLALLVLLVLRAGWLTAAGVSPLWGAFTFPLAAAAGALLAQDDRWLRLAGTSVLAAATPIVPWIAIGILRLWADGTLGPRTGAAVA
jgi:tellurite resistance protein